MKTRKLGIIGVGHVGEHVLAYAASSQLFGEIVTIDTREKVAYGEALDQAHATGMDSRVNARIYDGTYEDLRDADMVIISATHYYPDGVPADRQELLENNAAIIRQIMTDISQVTKEAFLIFITNPADTVIHIAQTEFDYPSQKILGTGTTLDSARLKYLFGQHYGVSPHSVHAYMMGEHGYSAFPVLSRLSIGGIPYQELSTYFPEVEPLGLEETKESVVQSAYEVFHAKSGVTNAGVAQASLDIARAILLDERKVYPISVPIYPGEYGADRQLAFSVPCIVGVNGVEERLLVTLSNEEESLLQASMKAILDNIDLLNTL